MCADPIPLLRVRDVEPRRCRTDLRCADAHDVSSQESPGKVNRFIGLRAINYDIAVRARHVERRRGPLDTRERASVIRVIGPGGLSHGRSLR